MGDEPITPIPGLGSGERPVLRDMDDIRAAIARTPKPAGIEPAVTIELGPCGMGMPVLKTRWALDELPRGDVVKAVSGHP